MILLYLFIPILFFVFVFYCTPYIIGWSIYNVQQDDIYNYNKNTLLYIKKKNKKVKKNDLIVINGKVCRIISADDNNAIVREEASKITVLNIKDGIDSVKFGISKVGIILSFFKKMKKKVMKK